MLNCDECGDGIFVGDEYYHHAKEDTNYHLDCIQSLTSDQVKNEIEKHYRED